MKTITKEIKEALEEIDSLEKKLKEEQESIDLVIVNCLRQGYFIEPRGANYLLFDDNREEVGPISTNIFTRLMPVLDLVGSKYIFVAAYSQDSSIDRMREKYSK